MSQSEAEGIVPLKVLRSFWNPAKRGSYRAEKVCVFGFHVAHGPLYAGEGTVRGEKGILDPGADDQQDGCKTGPGCEAGENVVRGPTGWL